MLEIRAQSWDDVVGEYVQVQDRKRFDIRGPADAVHRLLLRFCACSPRRQQLVEQRVVHHGALAGAAGFPERIRSRIACIRSIWSVGARSSRIGSGLGSTGWTDIAGGQCAQAAQSSVASSPSSRQIGLQALGSGFMLCLCLLGSVQCLLRGLRGLAVVFSHQPSDLRLCGLVAEIPAGERGSRQHRQPDGPAPGRPPGGQATPGGAQEGDHPSLHSSSVNGNGGIGTVWLARACVQSAWN